MFHKKIGNLGNRRIPIDKGKSIPYDSKTEKPINVHIYGDVKGEVFMDNEEFLIYIDKKKTVTKLITYNGIYTIETLATSFRRYIELCDTNRDILEKKFPGSFRYDSNGHIQLCHCLPKLTYNSEIHKSKIESHHVIHITDIRSGSIIDNVYGYVELESIQSLNLLEDS